MAAATIAASDTTSSVTNDEMCMGFAPRCLPGMLGEAHPLYVNGTRGFDIAFAVCLGCSRKVRCCQDDRVLPPCVGCPRWFLACRMLGGHRGGAWDTRVRGGCFLADQRAPKLEHKQEELVVGLQF